MCEMSEGLVKTVRGTYEEVISIISVRSLVVRGLCSVGVGVHSGPA